MTDIAIPEGRILLTAAVWKAYAERHRSRVVTIADQERARFFFFGEMLPALAAGSLRSRGVVVGHREEYGPTLYSDMNIPPEAWRLRSAVERCLSADQGKPGSLLCGQVYMLPLFSPEAITAWACREEVPQPVPILQTAPTPPGALAPPPSAAKPKFTDRAAHQSMRDRVAGWPRDKPPPSEEADHNAAKEHFGSCVPRDDFRTVRRAVVPPDWLKQGPRKALKLAAR